MVCDDGETKPDFKARLLLAGCALFTVFALGAILYFGLNLPIQTDEIAESFSNHRAILDHFQIMYMFPQCGEKEFSQQLPLLWYLPAYINYLLFSPIDHPMTFRLIAMGKLFAWIALWLVIFKRVFHLPAPKLFIICAIIFGVFGTDAEFFMLFMGRPEQSMVLGVSIAVALAVYAPDIGRSRLWALLGTALFIVTALQVSMSHGKAAALLPIFLVASYRFVSVAFRSRAGMILPAVIGVIFLWSYSIWVGRFHCPDSPAMQSWIANRSFPFHLLWENPIAFVGEILREFVLAIRLDFSFNDAGRMWFVSSDILGTNLYIQLFFLKMGNLFRLTLLFAGAFSALRLLKERICFTSRSISLSPDPYNDLALSVIASLLILILFQGPQRVFYFGSLEIPLMLMVMFLTLGRSEIHIAKAFKWSPAYLGCAFAAVFFLLHVYTHPSTRDLVIPERIISFPADSYTERLPAIKALAQQCDISTSHSTHVVVNDITYLAFKRSFQPYHIFYATGGLTGKRAPVRDFMVMLDKAGSDGILSDCKDFPYSMLPYATQKEGFCCIPKTTIHDLAKGQKLK